MTIKELKEHCIKVIKMNEAIATSLNAKVIDDRGTQEHKLVLKLIEAWESLREELKYELCKKVHEKDSYIPCPNQTTSCSYTGLRIYELNNIINHVIDKHLSEVS